MSAQEFDRWAAFAKFDHMWVASEQASNFFSLLFFPSLFPQLPVYDQTCPV